MTSSDGIARPGTAGKAIAVRSAYRSYADQTPRSPTGWPGLRHVQAALRWRARPGHSEHQLGTTIDFRSASCHAGTLGLHRLGDDRSRPVDEEQRLEVRLRDELPQGQVVETCYTYESWHYRYVGRTLAARIHDSGLTIREYLWRHYESVP